MHRGTPQSVAGFWRARVFAVAAVFFALLSLLLAGALYQANSQARAESTQQLNWSYASSQSGTVSPAKRISISSDTAAARSSLTPQQLEQRRAMVDRLAKLPKPQPQHVAASGANIGPTRNMEVAAPKQAAPGGPLAGADGVTEMNTVVNSVCVDCAVSSVAETSVAGNGKYLFMTGNWFTTYTVGGSSGTWFAINPYTYDPNFCCDQHVIYEPTRNIFLWTWISADFGAGTNALNIAVLPGNLATICQYKFNSTHFGLAPNQMLDFPDITFGTDDTYLTWNTYDPTGATWENTGLLRIPTDKLAACGGLSFDYTLRTDVFTFSLVSGGTEALNFASQWCVTACTTGSQMMFYNWAESASSYGILKLNINPYPFTTGGGDCSSANGHVTNWCDWSDSRRGGAYVSRAGYRGFGGQVIGFAWSAAADPAHGFPKPYVVRNYFVLPTLTYKGSDAIFSTHFGVQYPNCADTPYRGYVACTYAAGGGDASSGDIYPGTWGIMENKQYPNAPWITYTLCDGTANAPTSRWGDYTTTAEYSDHLHWVQGAWCMQGSSVVTKFAIVGLQRDHGAYLKEIGH